MHEGPGGGHFGVAHVQQKLSSYYWPSLVSDVKKYIMTCKRYQRMNSISTLKPKVSLKPIPVPSHIFAQIGMDLIHMTPSAKGYNYIITAVDYLSKYCEMRALKEKSAKEVAKFIYEDLVCRWGCTEYHITDQGQEFVNAINTNLLEMCETKQRITSAFHPQGNGLCECLNRSTQETLAKTMTDEKDWVEMIPTVVFSHRTSMSASTNVAPLELILGCKPRVPIDIHMKYPTDEDLDRDMTAEEAKDIAEYCLSFNVKQMKKVKEAAIGKAKLNIANAQNRYKRNYDKRFANREVFKMGDLVLLENQRNKNRKGGKRDVKYSGPYTIMDISVEGNCTLKHETGGVAKRKYPLAHLKRYHERNLVVGSEEEKEELVEEEEITEENSIEVRELLDMFDDKFVQNEEEKKEENYKDFTFLSESQPSIAENVLGLKKKKRIKRKRISVTGIKNDVGDPKKRITLVENLHSLTLDDADTLPDLDEKFDGDQSTVNSPLTGLSSFTSKHFVTGDHDVTGKHCVTGGLNVSGVEYVKESPVNGGQLNGGQSVAGEHLFKLASSRLQKARKRLSLSLKKRKITGDQTGSPGNLESKSEEVEGIIQIDSDDSIEYIPPDDLPGNEPARWVFIPVGQNSRRRLAGLFGMNKLFPLPQYRGVLKELPKTKPKECIDISPDGNCLFNAISYQISGDEMFHDCVRQKLCDYIEGNWKQVSRMAGVMKKEYKSEKEYMMKKKMRTDGKWGGSVELCALSFTGIDVLTFYMGGYHKFGRNKSQQCFFLYNSGGHYDLILEP